MSRPCGESRKVKAKLCLGICLPQAQQLAIRVTTEKGHWHWAHKLVLVLMMLRVLSQALRV